MPKAITISTGSPVSNNIRCVRLIMGITRFRQWKERITTRRVALEFGMRETMTHVLLRHRLRWLGHIARMQPVRLPKQLLFAWRAMHDQTSTWCEEALA